MSLKEAEALLVEWGPHFHHIKIGMELFYKGGPAWWNKIRSLYSGKIFLDLKLHDIPQTVKLAVEALGALSPDFLTIHLAGGERMLEAALEAVEKNRLPTKLLGVSILTSLAPQDWADTLNIPTEHFQKSFLSLTNLATKVGLPGLILSPQELQFITTTKLIKVCPGIQFATTPASTDQRRVATPGQTFASGADYLVIGRAWRNASDKKKALLELLEAEQGHQ